MTRHHENYNFPVIWRALHPRWILYAPGAISAHDQTRSHIFMTLVKGKTDSVVNRRGINLHDNGRSHTVNMTIK